MSERLSDGNQRNDVLFNSFREAIKVFNTYPVNFLLIKLKIKTMNIFVTKTEQGRSQNQV